jgi:hypothetical protein
LVNNATVAGKPPFVAGYYSGFTNTITLFPGEVYNIPPGTWYITPGPYTFLQWLDPVTVTTGVTGLWRTKPTSATRADFVESDGSNYRLANMTGCAVGAVITSGGAGYPTNGIGTANGVTCAASSGASTWTTIVGGAVSLTVTSTTAGASPASTGGSGYNFPPICVIDAPPAGGMQATAYVTALSAGTVVAANVVITNQGAGYSTAPNLTFLPDPREAISATPGPTTQALQILTLTATGQLTGLYPTNHGTVLTGVPTLTFAGTSASTSAATATTIMNFCVTSYAITSAGSTLGAGTVVVSVSNTIAASVNFLTNPLHNGTGVTFPRPARIMATITGGLITTTSQVVEDAGLGIQQVPSTLVQPVITSTTSVAPVTQVAPNVGGVVDTSLIQSS